MTGSHDQPARAGDIGSLFAEGRDALRDGNIAAPDLDAGILLEHATGHGALARLTMPATPVPARKADVFRQYVARRLTGEPVHRITGNREFYGLPLHLNADTLIPRPETETLVDLVLPHVRKTADRVGTCRVLDLGTGSGAVALAILAEVRNARATGVDIADGALEAARANADALSLGDRFATLKSDWFSAVRGEFDLIVSNPPYIAAHEFAALETEVRDHEPRVALYGGMDGLNAYGIIAARAMPFLAPNGRIAVEIGHDQRLRVTQLFEAAGFTQAAWAADISGNDRAVSFVK